MCDAEKTDKNEGTLDLSLLGINKLDPKSEALSSPDDTGKSEPSPSDQQGSSETTNSGEQTD